MTFEEWVIEGEITPGIVRGVIYHGPNGDREEIITNCRYVVCPQAGETTVTPFLRSASERSAALDEATAISQDLGLYGLGQNEK